MLAQNYISSDTKEVSFRRPIEVSLLGALLFFLPLWEVPKNLLWFAWACTWLYNRRESQDYGGSWRIWDSLFLVWLGSAFLVPWFAGLPAQEWRGTRDVLRIISVGWLTSRAGYTNTEKLFALTMSVLGLFVGLIWAFLSWLQPHTYLGIQLHSVGHVNQTAIFMATSWCFLLALVLIFWQRYRILGKVLLALTVLASLMGFVLASSRAATAFIILISLAMGIIWIRRSVKPFLCLLLGIVLFSTIAATLDTEMRNKTETALAGPNGLLNVRLDIWRSAEAAWIEYPWFGVGLNNFNQINLTRIQTWTEQRGKIFSSQEYEGSSHAHSLYWNTLAERGIIGCAAVLLFLLSVLVQLVRYFPKPHFNSWQWLWWYSAAGSVSCILLIGIVNTTLHDEHGLLGLLLIGFWLSSLPKTHACRNQAV